MKPSLLTLLCLLPFALQSLVVYLLHRKQSQCWEHERAYRFWSAQCNEALKRMKQARSDEEYERWNATMCVNMRRYEQEVLGR